MADMPKVGAVLAQRFLLLETLGFGGMGIVFRAENVVTGKHVALKWLHPRVAAHGNRNACDRLLREARTGSSLRHPNVVDVYDVVHDGNTCFLVMELLRGETLRSYLKSSARPKVSELIALLLQAMSGVIAAHERGIVHRDLKPENIFLERVPGSDMPTVKVLDFGIAKLTGLVPPNSDFLQRSVPDLRRSQGARRRNYSSPFEERHAASGGETAFKYWGNHCSGGLDTGTLTETGIALGTPFYMSLEQLRGDRDIDVRADVYALGVMLYEAFTGRYPHRASCLPELAIKVATTDPSPLQSLRPDLPCSLARIVDWAIARERKDRLPDVQTVQAELDVFSREHGLRQLLPQPESVTPRLAALGPMPSAEAPVEDSPFQWLTGSASPAFATCTQTRCGPHWVERAAWLSLVAMLLVLSSQSFWRERARTQVGVTEHVLVSNPAPSRVAIKESLASFPTETTNIPAGVDTLQPPATAMTPHRDVPTPPASRSKIGRRSARVHVPVQSQAPTHKRVAELLAF